MTDPYVIPSGNCLRNKIGIVDPQVLAATEARIVSVRDVEIARATIPGDYGIDHLKAFHRALFRDIYDWAGLIRTVDISKADSRFCNWRYIEDEVSTVLSELAARGHLVGYNRDAFVQELAYFYGEINARHPFREGNGRALRAFLRQLAAAAGYLLDWSELSKEGNIDACRHNLRTADTSKLVTVLDPVVRRM
ncbi:Fic family protein [Catellatospora sp. NPDC049111]|uniref:Fic/DOC family protein n=1 Tax=Catellatospora sp. NPDC049111 TaxID=3155271 RepID=UPI0033E05679